MVNSIGVVILDFNQSLITARCLRSLAKGDLVPDVVVLIENGSEPLNDMHDDVASLNLIKLHPGQNLGCAGGRNLGLNYLLANSQVTAFVVLDNDTVIPKDFVKRVSNFAIQPLEVVAPVIVDINTKTIWSCGGTMASDGSIEQLTVINNTQNHEWIPVDWSPGACLIMTRNTWEIAGEFDNWVNFLFEDIEWCLRIKKAGGRVLIRPDLQLFHDPHQSLGGRWSPTRVRFWARNGTFIRVVSLQASLVVVTKWLTSEIALVVRDLVTGRASWASARMGGLMEGLHESIRRRISATKVREHETTKTSI